MVKLNRIYTKTGDDGTTGLATGARVLKSDLRVAAYGDVDEANSSIGVAIVAAGAGPDPRGLGAILKSVQHDLFDAGADLATPVLGAEAAGSKLRIVAGQTARLEGLIDRFNEPLAALTSFVLPGGSALAAALHVARTVVRRAERTAVELQRREPAGVNGEVVRYLNRLSDLLFVLARVANDGGRGDVLWVPGSNRAQ
ncbi:MAG: cob(I)yrinic acid a,c-diamide adenosyltransferase [Phycisphaerales bacterium]|nr:cob(I)yrinic acid a,c-diamide adenosyltransferase [Phycisphaerales bacterium]